MTWNLSCWMRYSTIWWSHPHSSYPPPTLFAQNRRKLILVCQLSHCGCSHCKRKSPPLDMHYGLYILTIYGVCNLCAKLGGERQFGLNGLSFYVFNLKFGFLVIKFFSLRISMERWGLLSQVFQRIYLLVCGS